MNLAKRLIRISAVTAAAVLMYEGAVTLDRTTEASASMQADASPNTKEKAPETDIINKETTAETETETKEEPEVPVKNSSKKTTLSTEKSTEKKPPLKKETENERNFQRDSDGNRNGDNDRNGIQNRNRNRVPDSRSHPGGGIRTCFRGHPYGNPFNGEGF